MTGHDTGRRALAFGPINTIEELRTHVQWAVIVEFTTIPPYLTAMYSITDRSSEVFSIIRSVVLEEMLHLNLASNLLNAIGASPQLVGEIPQYPTRLAHQSDSGPYIQLMAASTQLVAETFMAIEQPAPPTARAQADNYSTIGQLYEAIADGFDTCVRVYGAEAVFRDTGYQRTDWNFGNSGGTAFRVTDLATAHLAIREIVEQGEGAETVTQPVQPLEPWAEYQRYGRRADGTYGPILGTPVELSHYYKFQAIANGAVPMPEVYPMLPNPSVRTFGNPLARDVAEIFNGCYGVLVRALEEAMGSPEGNRDFFGVVVPLMQQAMPALATQLMQIPLDPESDSTLGPTAGPPFAYDNTPVEQLQKKVNVLIGALEEPAHGDAALSRLVGTLNTVATTLAEIGDQVGPTF